VSKIFLKKTSGRTSPRKRKTLDNLNKFNNYDKANYIITTHQGVFDATANHL